MIARLARRSDVSGGARSIAGAGILLPSEGPGTYRVACPRCATAKRRPGDGALAVTIVPDGHAVWKCWRCSWAGALSRQRTASRESSKAVMGGPSSAKPERAYKAFPDGAEALWNSGSLIEPGTLAATYFRSRNCPLPLNDVRWHPARQHPSGYVGPVLLARVTDAVTGEPISLHRTWLAPDGGGKALVDRPRLLLQGHRKAGGVVRLWPDEAVTLGLCVAEGIETALSAAAGFGLAWATIDAGNLADLPVLGGVEALIIVADHDEAGVEAAEACARRWLAAGREVRVWRSPSAGADFNDIARATRTVA